MPAVIDACSGSLKGKRVLDLACNSGFWSIQCALLGAKEVIGIEARQQQVELAELIRSIVGLSNVSFHTLNVWDASAESLGGTSDVVLNLRLLYH